MCTGMQVKTQTGTYVNGRTLEFAVPLDISGLVVPCGYRFYGTCPDGSKGLVYEARYGVMGAVIFEDTAVVDGFNEKGLTVGLFYFPNYAQYAPITKDNQSRALSPTEYVNWLLTQFATVEEVKKHANDVVICGTSPKGWQGTIPPCHYIVYDKKGHSVVIEPMGHACIVHDNPIGAVTNSPTFDWQMTNLANYINLSPMDPESVFGVKPLGQGAGMLGLRGDYTSPSRFVRAVFFSLYALPQKPGKDSVNQMFHLLNAFDIPVGAVCHKTETGQTIYDKTLATTVKDPEALTYFFRTYDNQQVRSASLKDFDLKAKDLAVFSMTE